MPVERDINDVTLVRKRTTCGIWYAEFDEIIQSSLKVDNIHDILKQAYCDAVHQDMNVCNFFIAKRQTALLLSRVIGIMAVLLIKNKALQLVPLQENNQ